MTGTAGTVLAADDDSDMRSLYRCWLAPSYDVRLAADGDETLRKLDETVDVVVLDREMPRRDGVDVAHELEQRDTDAAVVMISGVEPDVDLLDIPVDDYLQKPSSRETVTAHIERAAAIAECSDRHRRLIAFDRRRQIVESAVSEHRLARNPQYQRTVDRLDGDSPELEQARKAVPTAANAEQ
ncbi:response regulator transcription factor [Haloarcula sediminis]|uniref:response regulator transcription factor n=1 Tax=Haloarcula sediminis TaxID=3111777 RepID=UPI002D796CB2|nr:response regulator [Haloarcula sp. CK38]